MKKKLLSFLLVMVVAVGLGGAVCARQPSGEFRIAVESLMPENVDPHIASNMCKWYLSLLYDSLVGIESTKKELSPETGIAFQWEHSADYKDWTFYLREGIKFHNGDEVTAEDVKYSLDRLLGPVSVSSNKALIARTIDSVEIIDRYKVCIHCKKPDSMVPLYMSEQSGNEGMIVPKKYIEEKGDEYFGNHPIGTGPYKFKKHIPGSYMVFEEAGEHWYLGVPRYTHFRISIVPEAMARIGLLSRGEVDVIEIPRERIKEVTKLGFPIVQDPQQGVTMILFHETDDENHVTHDIRVRKALIFAIDRQAVLETLFGGVGELATSCLATPMTIGYEPADPLYPYDPERAKTLLKEAGYGPGNPCKIHIYSFPFIGFAEAEAFIETAASYWEKVGFEVEIVKLPEYSAFRPKWRGRTTGGGLAPQFFGARPWAMVAAHLLCHSSSPMTITKMTEMDAAIEKALAVLDPKERAICANKVNHILHENYLCLPLIMAPGCFAVNTETISDWKQWDMGATNYDYNLEWILFR
jgi:peptide/nickel transport system substrate-binding protein